MMKRNIKLIAALILFTQMSFYAFAQASAISPKIFAEFPLGTGTNEFIYSRSLHVGYSPTLPTFFHGDRLWISELVNGTLVGLKSKKIIGKVAFPQDYLGSLLSFSTNNLFTSERLFIVTDHIISYTITREPFQLRSERSYDNVLLISSPFLIHDYVFFYSMEGLVYAIDPDGTLLQPGSARQILLDWLERTWYASFDEKKSHRELILSGNYLIADGFFYPWMSGTHVLEYFQRSGIQPDRDVELKLKGGNFSESPYGVALNGDMYIGFSDGVNVISQTGKTLAIIDVNSINPRISDPKYTSGNAINNVSHLHKAVHSNGDLYTMYAIKDERVHLHKSEKSWGTDLIGIARAGVTPQTEEKTIDILKSLSSVELRLLRNAMFALHGYVFKSYDLSCYFRGFDWYTPDESGKRDLSLLTPEQKRLLDLISGIEQERVVK